MSVVTFTLLWLSLVLYAAAFVACLAKANNREANSLARPLLGVGVAIQLSMFIVMFVAKRFPSDYEVMNSLSKGFFTAMILFFAMKRHETRLPSALGIGLALFFILSRLYISKNLTLQDTMAHAFSISTVLFYHFSSLAFAFFGYCFCLSIGYLADPAKGAPGGVKTGGMLFKSALFGFVVFSFCQILGSAWSLTGGWGDVWIWASSHMVSAVVWIFYAGMLHVPSAKMPEKTLPVMGVVGFSFYIVWILYYDIAVFPAFKMFLSTL